MFAHASKCQLKQLAWSNLHATPFNNNQTSQCRWAQTLCAKFCAQGKATFLFILTVAWLVARLASLGAWAQLGSETIVQT